MRYIINPLARRTVYVGEKVGCLCLASCPKPMTDINVIVVSKSLVNSSIGTILDLLSEVKSYIMIVYRATTKTLRYLFIDLYYRVYACLSHCFSNENTRNSVNYFKIVPKAFDLQDFKS